ncbi:MAG TPA: 23S rRNA (guanosine(2251)-2'-O)-methyltransferase RlmB [Candidatus Polarisedimenticolia bacterium]|nr:23S rRNA (guanosine(2251)-2'-O)-methyltransferase RlmB [Candidatus Polarisedimenticolia bacterium]
MELLLGFNAVEAALQAERRTVDRVYVEKGRDRARLARLKSLAARHSVPVEEVDRARLERLAGRQPRSAHQGVLAAAAARPYEDPHRLVESCGREAIVLVVDGVEDPRNLGALIRTAAGAGAAAVFIPERRAAGLTATAARASAGATERVPVARVGNIAVFMKYLKEEGFWTIGLDAGARRPWDGISYPPKLALVVGGEGTGIRRLVRDTCDELVCLPLQRGVESLNVSVAAGVCLYEALRQRRAAAGG